MGIEKQGPKGGNYVGGFMQLFDWKAKSRKKLFSSNSDIPVQPKQKKRSDGNFPSTRIQMLDEDEMAAASSIRGSSDYSCASSVNDGDFYGTKAPGVVARLMGLDSLPKPNEPYCSPFFDSQSLSDVYFRTKNLEYCQDPQIMHSSSLSVQGDTKPKYQKLVQRPIEKFQTEILPPKSAKSIPITHHKLLSPIKSGNVIPPKDATHIMEAAARIIERVPQSGTKTKLPLVGGSSSAPLKVKELKEKAQAAQKRSKISERSGESSAVKHLKGHSMTKSYNGPITGEPVGSLADSEAKHKGKSISLALQAKANVQKRGNLSSSRTSVIEIETGEFSSDQLFKSQSTTQKSTLKKSSRENGSCVLRQNNQKQNCIADRGKFPLKANLQNGKAVNGDSSSARQHNSGKASGTSRVSSRKLGSDSKADKREAMSSSSERVTRKKRSINGTYLSEESQTENNEKGIRSSTILDRKSSWEQDSGNTGTDVISFTFTAPMTRSRLGSSRPFEAGKSYNIFSEDSRSKRTLLSSDGMCVSKFSFLEHNLNGGEALSSLLEQKLKELTDMVEISHQKSNSSLSSRVPENNQVGNEHSTINMGALEEIGMHGSNISQARKFLDSRVPSPVSVLEHSSFTESCNSTDTTDCNSTTGSKQCSSTLAREMQPYSLGSFLPNEGYAEILDSASSFPAQSVFTKRGPTNTLTLTQFGKRRWEIEYINEMLFNIEPMFKNYALGRATEIIDPCLFDQLESPKGYFGDCHPGLKINRRLMFDSVRERLDLRCRQYVNGGYRLWTKGLLVVRRNERLAEEVYKEISGWSGLGDSMVDEIVDNDMSSQYGRWLDFETEAFELGVQIESRILNSLIDEVVADSLVL